MVYSKRLANEQRAFPDLFNWMLEVRGSALGVCLKISLVPLVPDLLPHSALPLPPLISCSVLRAPCPPLDGLAVAISLLGPVAPEARVVLQSISLQPTQKVQEVRSDSLRSGNVAVLILVHVGGRLPSASRTAFALPYSP